MPGAASGRGVDDRRTAPITPIPVRPGETALLALAVYALDPARPRNATIARAIGQLSAAALDEHFPRATPPSLRDEILEYIEENLQDPGLGRESIAEAFGISLRWVHQVFTIDTETIARHVRSRRVRFVQEQLRSSPGPHPLRALAEGSGFKSRDSLTKVFKTETGMTVNEYAATHRGRRAQRRRPDA